MSRDPLDPTSDSQSSSRSNRDLIAASAYAVLAAALLLFGDGLTPAIRVPVALPLLLFVPGYVVVTALLPEHRRASAAPGSRRADGLERGGSGSHEGLTTLERFTLALVTSVAIVPTVALVANALVGVALGAVLVGVVVVTLLGAVLAATRRGARSGDGLRAARGSGAASGGAAISSPADLLPTDALTLAAVVISVFLLATSAAVAFSGAGENAGPTELAVGSDSGDEFTADGYPETLERGESETVDVAIEHGGERAREYEVIATLDAVEYADAGAGENDSAVPSDDENATSVTATTELDRYATTVEPDERSIDSVELAVPEDDGIGGGIGDDDSLDDGEDRRVTILLYEEEAPDEPEHEAAHRTVSLPVEVVEDDSP